MKIAVIGSRQTPMVYNRLLFGLVSYWSLEHEIRSGLCATGPDSVVTRVAEQLAIENKNKLQNIILYPPKKQVRSSISDTFQYATDEVYLKQVDIVDKLHHNPDALTTWMYALHCRNLSIISGVNLDDPVDLVVYAHCNVKVTGGTYMGVAYAESVGIPTVNVVHTPLSDIVALIK